MAKKIIVLSLGGSLMFSGKDASVNTKYLLALKKVLTKHKRNYKFVLVCGGGSIARTYIMGLRAIGANDKLQSMSGIAVTRMNARFMSHFFGKDANEGVPHDMKTIKNLLKKNDVVFCGALRYQPKQTSDSTSAQIAEYLKAPFINLTNVDGLYDKNPKKYKSAKFIPTITWKDFLARANELKFTPGQHFVLDQTAAKLIKDKKITTHIMGTDIKQLDKFLSGKAFKGTTIQG